MRPVAALLATLALTTGPAAAQQDTLPGELLRRLPIDDPAHALPLIPGVLLRAGSIGIDTRPTLLIRASRSAAANVYVDGASLRFQTLGTGGLGLPLGAIDGLAVVTGVAPVEIAEAGGGALLYSTRRGGDRWTGDVRWDSDEPLGDRYTVGYNRIEANGGGPLGGARLFVSAALHGQRSSYRGFGAGSVPTYMPAGIDTVVMDPFGGTTILPQWAQWSGDCDADGNGFECQGLRRPLDWSSARRVTAKLEQPYAGGRVSLTGLAGDFQQRFFPGQSALVPEMYSGRRASSLAAIVNWSHALGSLRGGPLELGANVSFVRHGDRIGLLESDVEAETRDPVLGIAFDGLRFLGADALGVPVDAALIRDVRTNSGTRGVPFFGALPGPGQQHRGNPYGVATQDWWTSGIDGPLSDVDERRVAAAVRLAWRPGSHLVTLGVDGERSRVASYATASLSRQIELDAWTATPRRLGMFVGGRLVAQSTSLDLGLRYDRFNAGGEFPNTPGFIQRDTLGWNRLSATDDTAYANSVARVFHPARTQGVLSPRVRLHHELSPRASVSLSYGRTVEMPAWATYFANANSDLTFTSTLRTFGRDIDFPSASIVEARVHTRLGSSAALDLAVYQKDLPSYGGRFVGFPDPIDPTTIWQISVVTPTNLIANGVDVRADWLRGRLSASLLYSLTHVRAPDESFGLGPVNVADVTTHGIAVAAGLRAAGVDAHAIGRAQSGEPYTLVENAGRGTLTPFRSGRPIETLDASRTPWTTYVDLRVAKAVHVAGRDWSLYLDARNVLNARNVLRLFAETGATENARHRAQIIGDTAVASGEFGALWDEANEAGALGAGNTVDLSSCAGWGSQANCVALTRVERRFGDGDGQFTLPEQERAFHAYYDDFFGSWRLYAPGRTIRLGLSLEL